MCEIIWRILHIFPKKQKIYMIYFVVLHTKIIKLVEEWQLLLIFLLT